MSCPVYRARPLWGGDATLPNGTEFKSWERPLKFTRTYYVDNKAHADDQGAGSGEKPFRPSIAPPRRSGPVNGW
jgi:hypothetical protein